MKPDQGRGICLITNRINSSWVTAARLVGPEEHLVINHPRWSVVPVGSGARLVARSPLVPAEAAPATGASSEHGRDAIGV